MRKKLLACIWMNQRYQRTLLRKSKGENIQSPLLGLILTINNEIQHIERYQCLYHELLVHLPVSFCAEPKTALIIGGGSLFAAHEILKYPSIKKVVLCDHDHSVLDLMEKYYSHAKMVKKDLRFHFIEQRWYCVYPKCSRKI